MVGSRVTGTLKRRIWKASGIVKSFAEANPGTGGLEQSLFDERV